MQWDLHFDQSLVLDGRKFTIPSDPASHLEYFAAVPNRPGASISKTEAVAMQVKKMIAPAWKLGKVLLLFCNVGGLCGAAIAALWVCNLAHSKILKTQDMQRATL
jgi:hypothetical protein